MSSWNLLGFHQNLIVADTVDEASAKLGAILAAGPEVRTIMLLLNPRTDGFRPWLDAVKIATPETRGLMVQRFFAQVLIRAGYNVVIGRELDIFARSRLRSLLIEVKSSLAGGRFGSRAEINQLDGYLIASERRRAERWLGTMGIENPILLRKNLRNQMRARSIGHLSISWLSIRETLLPHISSIL